MNTLYYVQDSRFFDGSSVVWLSEDGGYTPDLRKAKVFTKEESQEQLQLRNSDVAWPKDYIDGKLIHTVTVTDIEQRQGVRSQLKVIPLIKLPYCANCDDVMTKETCALFSCTKWEEKYGST